MKTLQKNKKGASLQYPQPSGKRRAASASSIQPSEIAAFETQASHWWDPDGPFRPLHRLNPVRIDYIKSQIAAHWAAAPGITPPRPLRALDIGCGGGLVTEALARLGLQTMGVDAGETAIAVANRHAASQNLTIDYRCGTAESLLPGHKAGFDVITALEIVEHVADVASFTQTVARLLRPGGLAIFSTLNKTARSFALGIVAAEYLLRWVPKGTHDWHKFISPGDLARHLHATGLTVKDSIGLKYSPLSGNFALARHDLSVNYFLIASKP